MKDIPAFPSEHMATVQRSGMTLRDYFAAKAMQMAMQQYKLEMGIFGEPIPEWKADACLSHVAADAYRMADAMLLERSA